MAMTFETWTPAAGASNGGGQRRCRLSVRGGAAVAEGPGVVLPTAKGSLPHVTPQLLATLAAPLADTALLATLSDAADDAALLRAAPQPRAAYGAASAVADPRRVLLLAPAQPSHARPLPVAADGAHATVATRRGREHLSSRDVAELALRTGADVVALPAAEATFGDSVSRHRKCAAAALALHDNCAPQLRASDVALAAPVLGAAAEKERVFYAREACRRRPPCVMLCGFGLGESAAERAPLVRACVAELAAAGVGGPRFVQRIGSPEAVCGMVALGVDFFCTDYPQAMADAGYAICSGGGVGTDPHKVSADDGGWARENRAPLVAGCECYACSEGFSRAYIHHLRSTHEMLADILLHVHNTFRYARWFAALRAAIDAGHFEEFRSGFLTSGAW